jgi:electron transfer flavoprotein alpha subunit
VADVSRVTLLVVVEPPGDDEDAAATTGRVTLAAEAGRLAAALGARSRFVTWPADPEVDFDSLAASLADLTAEAQPLAVLVQDGDTGRRLAPLIALRLGTGAVLGCSDVMTGGRAVSPDAADAGAGAPLTFVKPVYGGWLEQEVVAAKGFVPVVTLDLAGVEFPESAAGDAAAGADGSVEGASGAAALARAEVLSSPGDSAVGSIPRVRHLETIAPDARSVDLTHAKRIVAAGMGTASDSLLAAVHELADLLEGSVGATRPMVDEGRLPKERLIGQTGRTVAPDLYVALGISGSPHHMAGVRKADRVLSINRDARAPIFQFSDIGYVADLEEVLPALVAEIVQWRDAQEPASTLGPQPTTAGDGDA